MGMVRHSCLELSQTFVNTFLKSTEICGLSLF